LIQVLLAGPAQPGGGFGAGALSAPTGAAKVSEYAAALAASEAGSRAAALGRLGNFMGIAFLSEIRIGRWDRSFVSPNAIRPLNSA
jgi:hypothetical protein